jgi:hypothetical protein
VTVSITSPTPAGFAPHTALTNSVGTYTIRNLPAGRDYTLKPTKSGFTFNPPTRSILSLSADQAVSPNTSFTGTPNTSMTNDQYVDTMMALAGVPLSPLMREALINDLNSGTLSRGEVYEKLRCQDTVDSVMIWQQYYRLLHLLGA